MGTLVGADEPERPSFLSDNLRSYPITRLSVCSGAGGLPIWWNNAAAQPVTWPRTSVASGNYVTYSSWRFFNG